MVFVEYGEVVIEDGVVLYFECCVFFDVGDLVWWDVVGELVFVGE